MTHTCSRCDHELEEPLPENADYVIHTDFEEEEEVEVHYALQHTPTTTDAVQHIAEETGRGFHELAAAMARPNAPDTKVMTVGLHREENDDGSFVETAQKKEFDFSIPEPEFEKVKVDTPERIKDKNVAYVKTVREQRPVQKTGLVCCDCCKPNEDDIIWGPDSE